MRQHDEQLLALIAYAVSFAIVFTVVRAVINAINQLPD